MTSADKSQKGVKYVPKGSELKAESIFDEIPAQLSKHEKKFKLSSLKKDAKMRDYDDAFMWLKDSRIVNVCYNADELDVALKRKRAE